MACRGCVCVAVEGCVHVVCTLQAGDVCDSEWQAGAVCMCQAGAVCVFSCCHRLYAIEARAVCVCVIVCVAGQGCEH